MNFVFDLDGTICFNGQPISDRLLISLEELVAKGHEVIFASARPVRDLLPILDKRFHSFTMIGGNGSMVAIKGRIVSKVKFEEEILKSIVQLLDKYNVTYLIDSDWDYAYTGPSTHPILRNVDPQQNAKRVSLEELPSVLKILMLTSDNMEKIEVELREMDVVVHSHGNEGVLDVSPNGIDKWSALQTLGIKEGEYIAFGNDANDITMFQNAKCSIMIGDNQQLEPISSEQLPLNQDIENLLVKKIVELGDMMLVDKPVRS